MSTNTNNNDTSNEYTEEQQTPQSAPQRVLEETQRQRQAQAPIDSGQQTSNSVGQSENGEYSQPESGFGQPDAQGGNTQGPGGYNQGTFNQSGSYSDAQGAPQQRQEGYRDTEGSGYGQPAPDAVPAQEGYDPAHSGVRHAQNKPGEKVDVPGRETGSSWGQDQQMGYTTDTPDRKNPAL